MTRPAPNTQPAHDPAILVYAFRYALGRSSYAVGDVISALLRADLPDNDRRMIVREINGALGWDSPPLPLRDEWRACVAALAAAGSSETTEET